MSELTREEFLASQQLQIESSDKASERTVAAIRDLGKDLRSAVDSSTSGHNGNGSSMAIGLVLTVMLTLFGTSITLIVASHMIFQGQIDSVGVRIHLEREDRLVADRQNEQSSKDLHVAANDASKSRHKTITALIESNKQEMIAQLYRLESYNDEIVNAAMRRLVSDGQIRILKENE